MSADSFGFTFWGRREGEREHAVGVEDRDATKLRKMYRTVTHSEEEEPRRVRRHTALAWARECCPHSSRENHIISLIFNLI